MIFFTKKFEVWLDVLDLISIYYEKLFVWWSVVISLTLFVFDYTLTGSSDEGFLVTTKGIHIKNSGEDKIFFRFDEINRVEYKGLIFKDFYINDVKIGKVGVESSDIKSAIRAIEEYKRTFIKFPSPV